MSYNFKVVQNTIAQTFALDADMLISKEKIIEAIAGKISDMLEWQTEQLFSMLYRLDISEKKLKEVMQSAADVPLAIATLIYERQIEKIEARANKANFDADVDLAW